MLNVLTVVLVSARGPASAPFRRPSVLRMSIVLCIRASLTRDPDILQSLHALMILSMALFSFQIMLKTLLTEFVFWRTRFVRAGILFRILHAYQYNFQRN